MELQNLVPRCRKCGSQKLVMITKVMIKQPKIETSTLICKECHYLNGGQIKAGSRIIQSKFSFTLNTK